MCIQEEQQHADVGRKRCSMLLGLVGGLCFEGTWDVTNGGVFLHPRIYLCVSCVVQHLLQGQFVQVAQATCVQQ